MPKLAAIYARVSTHKQKVGENVESQISTLLKFAEEQAYVIPNGWIFKDEGYSGAILQRPALDDLRELIRLGEVNSVLVYSPDRLSRKYVYQLLLDEEFQKVGTELIFFNTPQAKTPEEQLSVHFKGIFAEYERAQIAERSRRGRHHRAKQGCISVVCTPPYGYNYRRKNPPELASYVIDETASKVVKKIFSLYAHEQMSITKIALHLEEEGILSPKCGHKWHRSTIRDILRNPAYTGSTYFGKSERVEGVSNKMILTKKGRMRSPQKSRKQRPMDLWTRIPVPVIIDETVFQLAQSQLGKNQKMSSRNTREPSILQGLLICGQCGRPYYKKKWVDGTFYCCSNRLEKGGCKNINFSQKNLEDAIWSHMIDLLKQPHLIEEEIENRLKEGVEEKQMQRRRQEAEKEILRLNRARDKLLDAFQDGDCLTLNDLKVRMKAIEQQKTVHENDLKSMQAQVLQQEQYTAIKMSMEHFLKCLSRSQELSVEEKQKVLRLLVDEVVLQAGSIEIKHIIPISAQNSFPNENCPLRPDGPLLSSREALLPTKSSRLP